MGASASAVLTESRSGHADDAPASHLRSRRITFDEARYLLAQRQMRKAGIGGSMSHFATLGPS